MSTLRLEILTVERRVFDEEVNMVVAPGSEGMLGILPRHTPLLTALTYGELQVKKEGEPDRFFAIGGGVMEVQPDHVIVMADSAERADEIDVDRAKASQKRAAELLTAKASKTEDFAYAEAALRRSDTRLKVAQRRRSSKDRTVGPKNSV